MTKLHQPRFMCKPLQIVYAHINPRLARQKEGQPASFYADAFPRAFPMALAEIPQERGTRVEPEEDFRRVWELRTVFRFAEYFGLVELRPDPDPPATLAPYLASWQVRKAPLLDQAVQWKVLPAGN